MTPILGEKVLVLELLEDFQERFFITVLNSDPPDLEASDTRRVMRFYITQVFNGIRREHAFFSSAYPLQYMDRDVEKVFRKYEHKEFRQTLALYQQNLEDDDSNQIESRVAIVSIILAAVSNHSCSLGMPVGKRQLIDTLTEMFGSYMEALLTKPGESIKTHKDL